MEIIKCDLCSSEEYEVLFSQQDLLHKTTQEYFQMVRCKCCGLHYLNPRPTFNEIKQYYNDNEYSFYFRQSKLKYKGREILRTLINYAYFTKTNSVSLMKLLSKIFLFPLYLTSNGRMILTQNIIPPVNSYLNTKTLGRILDIGCGAGENTHIFGAKESIVNLNRRGWEVYGIEPSDTAREIIARQGIKCYPDLFQAAFKDDFFDAIRMNWSLEHCHTPTAYLNKCKRILKTNGKFIIGIPNYNGIMYKLFPQCVEVPIHLYYFCTDTFKEYCNRLGFKIIDYYTFSYVMLFLTSLNLMGRPYIYDYFIRTPKDAIKLQVFLNLMSSIELGDDMVFCLSK